jgi:predicted Zn finger-like uncharacterized protein
MPSAPLTETSQAHSSTLTRCPECQTGFRVTADTLVLRQGMVRCGQCKAVFNALEHLVDAPPPEVAPQDSGDATTELTTNYDLFGATSASDDPATSSAIATTRDAAGPADALPRSALLHDTPRKRGFAWISMLGALLAGVALAAQATWFYRDKIAAAYPDAKPYLDTACAELGCRIKPPVDPQAISIESSDLQADQANRAVLILTAILRNRAAFNQALPMLELSLTDAQDQAVARRVLRPIEYAPDSQGPTIGAGSELQVRVFVDAGSLKANGYRLYAFYP